MAGKSELVGVVADGRLLELGTHHDLLEQGDRYATLFATWSSGGISGPELLPSP